MKNDILEDEKFNVVKEKQKNGDIYVYKVNKKYDKTKKYTINTSKHLIGKIIKGTTEIVPTRPKRKRDGTYSETYKKRIGMIDIISHVSLKSHIQSEVMSAVGSDIGLGQKMLTLAWYSFATDGNTWPNIRNWCNHYSGLLPYQDTIISQDMYHDVFVYLGLNEKIKQSIFMSRAKSMGKGELIALDSTTIFTEAENIECAKLSVHKDGLIKTVYKLVTIYSITSRQPIAYARISGNIPDIQTVPNALKELKALKLKKVEIVTDNGYYSEANILLMIKQGFAFITRVQTNVSWIATLIKKYRTELENGGEIMHCDPKFSGISIKVNHTFKYKRQKGSKKKDINKGDIETISKKLNIFIYYSSVKKAEEDIKFRKQFDNIRTDLMMGAYLNNDDNDFCKKYMIITRRAGKIVNISINQVEYNKKMKTHGYLVLVTNKEKDTNTCLEKYRAREYIEEDVKNHKSHTGGNNPRVWNDDTLDGQLLVQFLALSMHESFASMIRYLINTLAVPNGEYEHDLETNLMVEKNLKNWLRKNSMYNILNWFDTIETTVINDGFVKTKITTETSARDDLFFEKLKIKRHF